MLYFSRGSVWGGASGGASPEAMKTKNSENRLVKTLVFNILKWIVIRNSLCEPSRDYRQSTWPSRQKEDAVPHLSGFCANLAFELKVFTALLRDQRALHSSRIALEADGPKPPIRRSVNVVHVVVPASAIGDQGSARSYSSLWIVTVAVLGEPIM